MPSPIHPPGASLDLLEQLKSSLESRYAVERELGRGGMAIVYLARDVKHNRQVAIKVLRPELSASIGAERFLREIEIAAGLQHPHILPLYDSGEADGLLYYVMPDVEGETLRERLDREKQLPLGEGLAICRDVAKALSHAHSMGVIPRDIKPENILLSGEEALVADFGIARAVSVAGGETLTDSGLAIGTPLYMSPEQATGSSDVDHRSDIYALGCVLFEILVGEPPFTGPTPQAVIARHVSERPPSPRVVRPSIPERVEAVIETALAKIPADRFSTAQTFADALTAARPSRATPAQAKQRGHMAAVTAVAVAVAVVIVGLGVMSWQLGWLSGRDPARPAAPELNRIAILYFEDRSQDGSLRSVADGLTEDLIDELTRVEVLSVASRRQVRQYRGSDLGADSLARALSVDAIVDGTVSGSRERFTVTVHLVDGGTGRIVASHDFVGGAADVLQLRDSLVDEVAVALRQTLGEHVELRRRRGETSNAEAWLLVQQAEELNDYARDLIDAGDYGGARRALGEANSLAARAEQLDGDWVLPAVRRGWFAWTHAVLVRSEVGREPASRDYPAWIREGLGHADRALRKRAGEPRALELRGYLRHQLWVSGAESDADSLLEGAERDLRAALRWDPSLALSWYSLSLLLSSKGEFAEADVAARKALEKDAYLTEVADVLPQLYFASLDRGAFEDAAHWCEEGKRWLPDHPSTLECRLTILGWSGVGDSAVSHAWREAVVLDSLEDIAAGAPYRQLFVAAVLARSDMGDSAIAVIERTRERYPGETLYLQEAYVRLLLGEEDEVLRLLRLVLTQYPQYRDFIAAHYWFRGLHDDPRFLQLVEEGGP